MGNNITGHIATLHLENEQMLWITKMLVIVKMLDKNGAENAILRICTDLGTLPNIYRTNSQHNSHGITKSISSQSILIIMLANFSQTQQCSVKRWHNLGLIKLFSHFCQNKSPIILLWFSIIGTQSLHIFNCDISLNKCRATSQFPCSELKCWFSFGRDIYCNQHKAAILWSDKNHASSLIKG